MAVSKVLLEQGWIFHIVTAGLGSCDRDYT